MTGNQIEICRQVSAPWPGTMICRTTALCTEVGPAIDRRFFLLQGFHGSMYQVCIGGTLGIKYVMGEVPFSFSFLD